MLSKCYYLDYMKEDMREFKIDMVYSADEGREYSLGYLDDHPHEIARLQFELYGTCGAAVDSILDSTFFKRVVRTREQLWFAARLAPKGCSVILELAFSPESHSELYRVDEGRCRQLKSRARTD